MKKTRWRRRSLFFFKLNERSFHLIFVYWFKIAYYCAYIIIWEWKLIEIEYRPWDEENWEEIVSRYWMDLKGRTREVVVVRTYEILILWFIVMLSRIYSIFGLHFMMELCLAYIWVISKINLNNSNNSKSKSKPVKFLLFTFSKSLKTLIE